MAHRWPVNTINHHNQPLNVPELGEPSPLPLKPEFIRIPEAIQVFGVKRGVLYRLIAENKIRSINLRHRGAKTGVRLLDYDSLKAYLNQFAEGPNAQETNL